MIDQVVAAFADEARAAVVELTAVPAAGVPPALADEQRIRQVLRNLLSNALRYTPRGARITISPSVVVDGWLQVAVADSGSGIDPDRLPNVFDRFARDSGSPGSGLGLAICRDLVEAHGGRIEIESRRGVGTTVFTLPLQCPAPCRCRGSAMRRIRDPFEPLSVAPRAPPL